MTTYSVSRIKRYQQCPRSYHWYYDHKLPDDSFAQVDMDAGSIFHAAMEVAMSTWFITDNRAAALSAALDYIETTDLSGYDALARKMGGDMVRMYAGLIINSNLSGVYALPDGQPALELKLDFRTPNGTRFTGYVDAVLKVGDTVLLADYKTRGSLYPYDDVAIDSQLYLYIYGLQKQYGIKVDAAAQVQVQSKGSTAAWAVTKIDMSRMDVAVAALEAWASQIDNDKMYLPRFDSWHCKRCSYKDKCLAFMKDPRNNS